MRKKLTSSILYKLRSQRGATIIYGLLAILVATVVSVIILTAALTAVKRVNQDKAATQNKLTLESAAQLIVDTFGTESGKSKVSAVVDGESYVCSDINVSDSILGPELKRVFQSVGIADSETVSFSIEAENMDTVSGTIKMLKGGHTGTEKSKDFQLVISLSIADDDGTMKGSTFIVASATQVKSGQMTTFAWTPVITTGGD